MKGRALLLAMATLLATATAACGGGGSTKVDTAKVSSSLQKNGMAKKDADCVAQALDKAGLTVDDYRRFGSGKGPDLSDPKLQAYVQQVSRCFKDEGTSGS